MLNIFGLRFSQWAFILAAGDTAFFLMSIPMGVLFSAGPTVQNSYFSGKIIPLALLGCLYLLVLYVGELYDFYRDFRRREQIGQIILWTLAGALIAMFVFCLPTPQLLPRRFLEWQAVAFIWFLAAWRYVFSAFALPECLKRNVIIIGAGNAGRRILEAIRRRSKSGFEPVGFVDDDPAKEGTAINGVPVLGDAMSLESLIKLHKVDLLIMAITNEKSPTLLSTLTRLYLNGFTIIDMPSFYELLARKVPVDHISDAWLFINSLSRQRPYYRHFKRVMDVLLAVSGIIISAPLWMLVAAAIKLDSPGPVFYFQERLGKDGRPFRIIKFRTMVVEAEELGPSWASQRDPRITRVGHILRHLRLDELPQLVNILKGEMSFIGPRPEREIFIKEFQEPTPEYRPGRRGSDPPGCQVLCGYRERIPFYGYRLLVRPGITGWAQVRHYYTSSLEETKEKLEYDLYYIKNMSLLLEMIILLKTIRIVLFGRGR